MTHGINGRVMLYMRMIARNASAPMRMVATMAADWEICLEPGTARVRFRGFENIYEMVAENSKVCRNA